jgi:SpoVK/Ycf46/Vps4 family AAA+-type ATPase/DNA-binding transcriptional MerR regulator
LKKLVVGSELCIDAKTLDLAISEIDKKRMLDGFGNAGEAGQILNRAKLRRSARLSTGNVPLSQHRLLIPSDFAGDETSAEKAREAFNGLEFMDHVTEVIDELEAAMEVAVSEGKNPQAVVHNMHLIFHGPPGTGKTTCAKRFGIMFKNLNLLPRSDVEYVTASQLMGQYVGQTEHNTREALKRAKGGILFIDEAYAMIPARGSFGGAIMQVLLDTITTEEFAGKLIVVLSGYLNELEQLFNYNPGFQSRFDKKRLQFKSWTAEQATTAVVNAIKRDGKTITDDAVRTMTSSFGTLRTLQNWSSARDAMELIYQNLQTKRAMRWAKLSRENAIRERARNAKTSDKKTARSVSPLVVAYEEDDVQKVFHDAIAARGGQDGTEVVVMLSSQVAYDDLMLVATRQRKVLVVYFTQAWCGACTTFKPIYKRMAEELKDDVRFASVPSLEMAEQHNVSVFPTIRIFVLGKQVTEIQGGDAATLRRGIAQARRSMLVNHTDTKGLMMADGAGRAAPRHTVKHKFQEKRRDVDDGDEKDDLDDGALWAALEAACKKLGLSLQDIVNMLESPSFPPQDLLNEVMDATGCTDPGQLRVMLGRQRAAVLQRFKLVLQSEQKAKTEVERKTQAYLKSLGQCVMGFDWLKQDEGWRCAGGSHFMHDDAVAQHLAGGGG